jgi:ribosome modulation factor
MIHRIFQNASSPSMYLRLSEHFDLPRCHDGGECPLQAVLQSLEAELCPHTYLDVESRFLEGKRKKEFDFWSQQII